MAKMTKQQQEELRQAILLCENYMVGVRQALKAWRAGGSQVTPWDEVKEELRIR